MGGGGSFYFSTSVRTGIYQYSTMTTPGTPRRTIRRSPTASSVTPATPLRSPASPASPAGRVKGGEPFDESCIGMPPQTTMAMHPGEPRLRLGVEIAIATKNCVGKRYTSRPWRNVAHLLTDGKVVDLRSKERADRPSNLTPQRRRKSSNAIKNSATDHSAAQGRARGV